MHDIHLLMILILFIAGIAAGLIDTLAGGGGLIIVPVMLLLGIPPLEAMGANKLQACFGELTAIIEFRRKGHIKLRKLLLGFIFVAIGSTVGTLLLQQTHPELLKKLLPVLLALVLIYTIFSPRPQAEDVKARMPSPVFYSLIGLLIGFYNGYFGPGTGSFWVVAFMFFMGFNIRNASIHAKPLNFTSNIVALVWFILAGQIWYWAGISAGIGQIIGAKIGAHLVIYKGLQIIRPVFITIVSIMILSLIIKHYF